MNDRLVITKKLRGEDGYRTFSVRLREDTVDRINDITTATGRTRNELIGILLDYALDHSEVVDKKS